MAEQDSTDVTAALSADDNANSPRITLSEVGLAGLRITNKQILEESQRVFRFPDFLKTVNEMRNDPTVAAALNVYKMLISRVKWTVEAPEKATDQQKARAKFVQQCMTDMDTSWGSFINETLTYLEYGHSVQEKVFRRRLRKKGSRYNDGLIGLRKLAPRSQDTIKYWYFSDDGRDLVAIGQTLINLENGYRYNNQIDPNGDGVIKIDRSKFLLFTADTTKNNPQGHSLLKPIYLAYKRMQLLQEQELVGVAKDAAGLPLIQIPPKYMDANASPEDQAVYAMCKKIVDNLAAGTQRGIVFPSMMDPESKQPLFTIELLQRKGVPTFDLNEIIKRYQYDILIALSADIIKMGQGEGGSYALSTSKNNLLALAISHRLKEIAEVLNSDLIPQMFALNGWTDEELPKFVPGEIDDTSMLDFSSFIQRTASVGLLEIDRPLLNRVREVGGIPLKPEDEPVDEDNLTGASSRSGDGMKTGVGDGTSKDPFNKGDKSVANKENK